MPVQFITNKQFIAPSAANGVNVISAGAWTYGSWVQLVASADADWILTGAMTGSPSSDVVELQIGVGGAGSEVVIATFAYRSRSDNLAYVAPCPIPIDAIPSGSRVAGRIRDTGGTVTYPTSITYIKKPVLGNLFTTTEQLRCAVSGSPYTNLTVAPNSDWSVSGSWVEFIASAAADLLFVGAYIEPGSTTFETEIDIGVGGIGAEVVITTLHMYQASGSPPPWLMLLNTPLDAIPSGSRVAVRTRYGNNARVKLWYYHKA